MTTIDTSTDEATEWDDLVVRVQEMSTPHLPFFLLVTLSTTIAAFGLLANSTAVVIGAMLVAPLMGPIFGIALGLASGDTSLLGRALGAELKGMALSAGLAFLIGLVPNHPAFGSEILGRTAPTVYDIIVAMASGIAGAFALYDRRIGAALPGVAIATAIVPPLATVGLCLADGRVAQAGGAFLLFLANLLAIEAVAAAFFTWKGTRSGKLHEASIGGFVRHFGVSVVLLIPVAYFLTRTLQQGIARDRQREVAQRTIADALRRAQGARLDDLRLEFRGDTLDVFAIVLTPQEVAADEVALLEGALGAQLDPPVHLVVRSIIARDANRDGPVYVTPAEAQAARASEELDEQTRLLRVASDALRAIFVTREGLELEELRRERRTQANVRATAGDSTTVFEVDSLDVLFAVVRTPVPIAPPLVDTLTQRVSAALGIPIRLVVRSIITHDADATGFLHAPAATPQPGQSAARRRRPGSS